MVLQHACSLDAAANDRFHRALYEGMLHPELPTSSKQALFLNVVYKAMKADPSAARVRARSRARHRARERRGEPGALARRMTGCTMDILCVHSISFCVCAFCCCVLAVVRMPLAEASPQRSPQVY